MTLKSRSIGERLSRAKSPEVRREIMADWIKDWERDQLAIVAELNQALDQRDWSQVSRGAGQLRAVTQERLGALQRILQRLAGEAPA
ncbi:hypothetical protein [Rubellimicrobium aerolatum]|uniref:Uncharacterized protein n=1 Tax=Rubellimicrobium aerolatum TaxID=490979 RepID=A0ABW0SEA4_9RHOB|nr:hypothetical protein [Rubellimicrobium aerolatum]MBP1807000.1 hypothetical protein [Rubellimicrobium aerolatum]